MSLFNKSHDFYIKNLYASDGGGNDIVAMAVLDKLANAACLGAGHQSDERYDAPKCHPETRAAVINNIMSWVNDKDSNEPIMWMSGPAGAGKSAIAQTVCVKCHNEKKLLASFFFSRTATASGRSKAKRLVPTIACQLAIAIPKLKPMIMKKLNSDSAMLTYSMETQLQRLVLEPLAEIYNKMEKNKSRTAEDGHSPYLVVIDGLDECNDPKDQSRIVETISVLFGPQEQIHLRFLIASRPELEIRNSFKTVVDNGKCATIILNELYKPDDDIRTYLRSEFGVLKREHTLREYLNLDSGWPSWEDIKYLVEKSSGQFIYASTIMKYLRNPRRDPRQGLRAIQVNAEMTTARMNSTRNESPYTTLDLLYQHILDSSSADYDSRKIIFQILLFAYQDTINTYFSPTLDDISSFTGMTPPDLELLLADFHSILYVPKKDNIKFYHASFGDFLRDASRSGNFYISGNEAHKYLAQRCLSIILETSPELHWDKLNAAQIYSVNVFFEHFKDSDFDEELLTFLRSETTLHAVLNVLSKCHRYNSIKHVIKFSFDGKRDSVAESHPYWIPMTEKIQDICLAIIKFVEERFMFRIGLNGLDAIQALYYKEKNYSFYKEKNYSFYKEKNYSFYKEKNYSFYKEKNYSFYKEKNFSFPEPNHYFDWLLFLLENPIHGKQIYLNSENSFILYKKLIQETDRDTRRYYGDGTEKYYPFILRDLLMKIQPSAAYTDSNLFPRASEEVFSEIIQEFEEDIQKYKHSMYPVHSSQECLIELKSYKVERQVLEQTIQYLRSGTERFLKKCQNLNKQEEKEMKYLCSDTERFWGKCRNLNEQEEKMMKYLRSGSVRFLEKCQKLEKQEEKEMKRKQEEDVRQQQEEEWRQKLAEEEMKQQQEEELKRKQEEELRWQREEELKRKQEEDLRRQQEEELKRKHEEEFRRQKEEELKLKQQQEEQQTKRSFRNRLMSPIKNVQCKLKDKLR